jgi:hypothetical protein
VAELQTALDTWMRSVPEHRMSTLLPCLCSKLTFISVRWDPERTDGLFFHQSALLRSAYHTVRVMIYRPFIGYPDRDSLLARSAFAICTNESRECSRVLEAHQRRRREPLVLQTVRRPKAQSLSHIALTKWPRALRSHLPSSSC